MLAVRADREERSLDLFPARSTALRQGSEVEVHQVARLLEEGALQPRPTGPGVRREHAGHQAGARGIERTQLHHSQRGPADRDQQRGRGQHEERDEADAA